MRIPEKVKSISLLFILCAIPVFVFAQQIHLPLTNRVEDAQFNKLIITTPIFELRSDSVANPLDISAAKPEDKTEWKKVKLPATQKRFKIGYAWVFNAGAPGGFTNSHTLLIIQNPALTYYKTYIWTDRNNNLDLTDDGAPDSLSNTTGTILNLGFGINNYQLYVEHFPFDKFPQYAAMNDREMEKVKGERKFYGTAASFREKRLNVLAGYWKNGRDSFAFALKDVNGNGIYNEPGIDVALINDYNGTFDNLQGVVLDKKGQAYLEWNNCAYALQQAMADGSSINMLRDSAARLKYSLNLGDKMPRFRYCTATKPQKRKNVRRLKGSYTYLYVWRDGAADYVRDSASLHHLGRLSNDRFKVLALNYGASGRYVVRYNRLFNTPILQGFSSNSINRSLRIKKIPTGILLDSRQRIVAVGVTPLQAELILKSLSIL